MCERCRTEATGLRSGKGSAILSKLMGRYACKHTSSCQCEACVEYRDRNPYADTGLFLDQSDAV